MDPWHIGTDPEILTHRFLFFSSVADKMPTNNKSFFQSFFAYYLRVHLHLYSKIKVKKKKKSSRNQGFLLRFLLMERSGSVQIMADPDRVGPKTYNPMDTDPQTEPRLDPICLT